MPIYEYQCTACDHRLEALQKMSDSRLIDCPACHEPGLKKLISAAAFQLKGTGWYETDFKHGSDKKKDARTDGDKSDGDKSDAKASDKSGDSDGSKKAEKSGSNGNAAAGSSSDSSPSGSGGDKSAGGRADGGSKSGNQSNTKSDSGGKSSPNAGA